MMKLDPYLQRRDEIVRLFSRPMDFGKDELLALKYHIVSASLSNFLPAIDRKDHIGIFRGMLLHQQLSHLEQACSHAMALTKVESPDRNRVGRLQQQPSIICTFHTGSYRLLNLFLVSNRIPYSLVIASNVIASQGNMFNELYRATGTDGAGFRTIDAEHPSAGIKMLRELKQGRSLLVYMDGNVGAGVETICNPNHCKVNFLGQQLFARKGVGFLAHAARVPIIPVVSYRLSREDIRLRFYEPLLPMEKEGRDAFANRSVQHLHDLLAGIVERYPEQWEAWLYLHRSAHIVECHKTIEVPHPGNQGKAMLNGSLYSTFTVAGRAYLFNRNTYKSYTIDEPLHALLSACREQPLEMKKFGKGLFEQLCSKQVLLTA